MVTPQFIVDAPAALVQDFAFSTVGSDNFHQAAGEKQV